VREFELWSQDRKDGQARPPDECTQEDAAKAAENGSFVSAQAGEGQGQ